MEDKKTITIVIVSTIALLLGGVYFLTKLDSASEVQANPEAKVSVNETAHGWGTIGLEDGNVEKIFEIKNEGSEELILSDVSTSCMCTTAQLSLGDTVSPEFGMHTTSSFVLNVPPQKSAQLKVVFDPAFHGPSGVGPINRQVKVVTNDPKKPEINFMLTAMVKR